MNHNFKKCAGPVFVALALLLSFCKPAQAQNIITIAGNGTGAYNGDNIAATTAELNNPGDVTVDKSGNVYIADEINERIRKITVSTGIIATIAGNGTTGFSGDGGAATDAEINTPYGMAIDDSGNVYFADGSNQVVRKITVSTGIITTIAGNNSLGAGYNGDNIAATAAQLYQPSGVAFDDSGNIFIPDFRNQRIREIRIATGIITTIAGNGTAGFIDNVAATAGEIYYPGGIALDDSNNVYIADAGNNHVRKVSAKTGIISTLAGNGLGSSYSGDGGPATNANMSWPVRVAVDDSGNVIICDEYNERIRKVTKATGIINTIAGDGYGQGSLNGGYNGDNIPATSAELWAPGGVAADNCGNVYIADDYSNRIREVQVSLPTATSTIKISSTKICAGQSVTFTDSSDFYATGWQWSFPGGTPDSANTSSPVIQYNTGGTYQAILTVSNLCNSVTDTLKNITIDSIGNLLVIPQSPTICDGQSIALKVSGGGTNYTWSPVLTLSSSTGDNVIATPTVATTYVVTGTDSAGCKGIDSDVVSVSIPPNKPVISQSGDILTSSATQGNQWIRNDSTLQGGTNETYIALIPGWYQVIAENPANGCSSTSDSVDITSGINRLTFESGEMTVYPNPTGGLINLNISSLAIGVGDWSLLVMDVLGRTVYFKQSLNYNNEMDLSILSSGVYFICVMNKKCKVVVPVLKQN